MSFGDGIMLLGIELTAKQVEDAAADLKDYPIPVHCQVEDFGVYVTEDFVAQATDPIVALQKKTTIGGTATTLISLTLGSSNTTLKKGDGTKALQTTIAADTDLDNGDVVYAKRSAGAQQFAPGDVLTLRHNGAATGAGGAYVPWVTLRVAGQAPVRDNCWIQDD